MAVLLTKVDLCHEPWRSGHVTDTDLSCTYLGAAHSLPRRHGSPSDHLVHISRIFPAVIAGSAVYKGRGSIIRDEVTRVAAGRCSRHRRSEHSRRNVIQRVYIYVRTCSRADTGPVLEGALLAPRSSLTALVHLSHP